MAILQAVLSVDSFVQGADLMIDSLTRLFEILDNSFRTMQKFEITMSTFSGGILEAKDDLATLLDKSNELGVSFENAAGPFAKFASAATGFSKSQVFDIFDSFATSLSAVRANGNEVNGVFLALQQIVSKGKLSMEELRLQLAERIPGAMKLAAQAADMNMLQFEKAVQTGAINMNQWLLKFSDLLKETFGPAAEIARKSFDAQVQRMNNNLLVLNATLVETSGANQIWADMLKTVSDELFDQDAAFGPLASSLKDISNIAKDLVEVFAVFLVPALNILAFGLDVLARIIATGSAVFFAFVEANYALATAFYATTLAVGTFTGLIDEGSDTYVTLNRLIDESAANVNKFGDKAVDAFKRAGEPLDSFKNKIREVKETIDDGTESLNKQVEEYKKFAKLTGAEIKKDIEGFEDAAKEKEDTIEEMYKEAGLGSTIYFDNEATKLVKQISEWQKAGADIEKSNAFLYDKLQELQDEAIEKGDFTAQKNLATYMAMSRNLVDQLDEDNKTIQDQLEEVAAGIDGLNLKKISITASLQSGAMISGIDEIISKFRELQSFSSQSAAAQSAAGVGAEATTGINNEDTSDFWNAESEKFKSPITIVNNLNQNLSKSDITDVTVRQTRELSRE